MPTLQKATTKGYDKRLLVHVFSHRSTIKLAYMPGILRPLVNSSIRERMVSVDLR
jgi:hypothetical protein